MPCAVVAIRTTRDRTSSTAHQLHQRLRDGLQSSAPFYRAPRHEEGWTHSDEEILRRCGEAVDLGATQIMLQGGHSPELGMDGTSGSSAIQQRVPVADPALAGGVRGRAHLEDVPTSTSRR